MATNDFPNMRYDFSYLSKGRLRAYNRAVEELENLDRCKALSDDELEMLSAAGMVVPPDHTIDLDK